MGKVISVHEYQLKEGISRRDFEKAILRARQDGLLDLPGLVESGFLRRLRGSRGNRYGAIWVYESVGAWEALWGEVQSPTKRNDYPGKWREWEDEVLAKYLDCDPDRIEFNSYEEF